MQMMLSHNCHAEPIARRLVLAFIFIHYYRRKSDRVRGQYRYQSSFAAEQWPPLSRLHIYRYKVLSSSVLNRAVCTVSTSGSLDTTSLMAIFGVAGCESFVAPIYLWNFNFSSVYAIHVGRLCRARVRVFTRRNVRNFRSNASVIMVEGLYRVVFWFN